MELSVLLIDDNPIIHTLLVNALPKNITLHEAFNGDEGIEKATALLPDIILLDIEMPGRNSYETCEILKAQSETKPIPVFFLLRLVKLGTECCAMKQVPMII